MTQDSSFEIKTRWGHAPKPGEKDLAEIASALADELSLSCLMLQQKRSVTSFVRPRCRSRLGALTIGGGYVGSRFQPARSRRIGVFVTSSPRLQAERRGRR